MITLYSYILGIDSELVKSQTNASRSKIIALAQLLLIPVAIWFLSGFLMSSSLLSLSIPKSILVGAICAVLIYIVDRAFVTSVGHDQKRLMMRSRIAFAFLSALLGAIAIDTVIFGGDIKEYQREKVKAEFKLLNDSTLKAKQIEVDTAAARYLRAQKTLENELEGRGSGRSGYGPIAKKYEAIGDTAYSNLLSAQSLKLEWAESVDKRRKEYVNDETKAGSESIIRKIHDLHEFILSSWLNIGIYLLFFSLTIFLEIMLIIYKSGSMKTAFEEALLAEEEARMQRIRALKRNKEYYHLALENLGESNVLEMEKIVEKYKNVS